MEEKEADEVVICNLLKIRHNLIKELYEFYGEDLGDADPNFTYKNYLCELPVTLECYDSIGGNLTDFKIGDYEKYISNIKNLDKNAKISEHYTLGDLCVTSHKSSNNNLPVNKNVLNNLVILANKLIEPIYQATQGKIIINSAYRDPEVNRAVGGSPRSQHCAGQAVDLHYTGGSQSMLFKIIFNMIASGKIKTGQLLWEYGNNSNPQWVHVSLPYSKVNQVLTIGKANLNVVLNNLNLDLNKLKNKA